MLCCVDKPIICIYMSHFLDESTYNYISTVIKKCITGTPDGVNRTGPNTAHLDHLGSILPNFTQVLVIYSREKLKLFFPEGGATPKDVYFPSRRRGKYESEGVGTPQGEKSSISPRSL